jgi:ABC-2 type transport system permease protein
MERKIPATNTILTALLKTDFITQWRNRRAVILVLLVPILILISWKPAVNKLGGNFVLSTCITIGLTAVGLMGYANSIAKDRDKGVFQRLRVTPIPRWSILVSRLSVQLAMITLITILVFVVGANNDHIYLSTSGYILSYLTALVGGALYLSLGQMIVGLLKNAETVNATSRLVYFVFIMVGMFGDLGLLGEKVKTIIHWSPYGTVKTILSAGMKPEAWNTDHSLALLATIAYAIIFATLGIKKFRWNVK